MLLNFSIMRFQIRQMCKYVRDTTVCLLWDFDHLIEFCLKALFSITHIYANPSEIEETLFAAEWLYGHTGCKQTQRDAAKLVCAWEMKYSIGDGSDIRMKIL